MISVLDLASRSTVQPSWQSTWKHLLTDEVDDVHRLLVVGDLHVHWEVSEDELHAVLVALGDTDAEVHDVGGHSLDDSLLLGGAVPLLDLHGLLIQLEDVDLDVLERAGEGATGALHRHDAGVDVAGDALWDAM